jgi:hypothetical protein
VLKRKLNAKASIIWTYSIYCRVHDIPGLSPAITTVYFALPTVQDTNYSRTTPTLLRGCELHDVWDTSRLRTSYTPYAPRSASRLDRIYVTERLLARKQGVETVALAFTDHLAVVLRLAVVMPLLVRDDLLENEYILSLWDGLPWCDKRTLDAMATT